MALAAALWLTACSPSGPSTDDATAPSAPSPPPVSVPVFVDATAASGIDFHHLNGMSGKLYLAEITCGGGALFDLEGDGDLDLYLLQGSLLGPGARAEDLLSAPRHPRPWTDRLYRNEGRAPAGGARFADVTAASGLAETTGYGCAVAAGDVDNDGDVDLFLGNLGPNQLLRNRGDGTFAVDGAAGVVGGEESTTAAAFVDYDRDGWLDLYVANNVDFQLAEPPPCFDRTGRPDYCSPSAFPFQADRLYRNRGDGTFEETTRQAGIVGRIDPALGVVAADFDQDGWPDLYVANDGQPNRLWINQRDGTFADQALLAGAAVNARGETEASMGVDAEDVDRDGDLDLFLAHLVGETNTIYRNEGGAMFRDATVETGLGAPSLPYTAFGAGFLDYDNDGWLDLLVVNGAVTHVAELVRAGDPFPLHQPNQLFRNLGGGLRFAEVTPDAGDALSASAVSRGLALGDLDDDGDLDAVVMNNNGAAQVLLNAVGQGARWLGLRLVTGQPPRDAVGARAVLLRDGRGQQSRRLRDGGSYGAAHDPRLLFGLGDEPAPDAVAVAWPDGSWESFPAPPLGRYTTLQKGGGQPMDGAPGAGAPR